MRERAGPACDTSRTTSESSNTLSLYSVHFHHVCVHIMITNRHMLTEAPCSRLTTRVITICPLALQLHITWHRVERVSKLGNVPCLSRPCGGVLVISKHGRLAGSVDGTRGKKRRVTETGDGGNSEVMFPSVIDTRLLKQPETETEQTGPIRRLRSEPVPVHSAHTCGLDGTRAECNRPSGLAHSAK